MSYAPREPIWQTRPGDVLLVERPRDLLTDALVVREMLASGRRTWFNHAALMVGSRGEIVEATVLGVMLGNASTYLGRRRDVIAVLDSPDQRWAAADVARAAIEEPPATLRQLLARAAGIPGYGWTAPKLVAQALLVAGVNIDPSGSRRLGMLAALGS